jgi:hypothetical protein
MQRWDIFGPDWEEEVSSHGEWVKTKDAYATADKLAGLLGEAYQMIHAIIETNNDFGSPKMDAFRGAPDGEGSTLDRIQKALLSHTQEMCWDKGRCWDES